MKYLINLVVGLALIVGGVILRKNAVMVGLFEFNVGVSISMIGVTLIMFPIIDSFYIKPLREAIEGRNTELENTFAEAEELRAEMATMKTDYEKRLAETEASAREQIQAQIKEAQEMRRTLVAEANAQAEELKRQAVEEIAAEKQKAITELRVNVANLSLLATEKILSENMDNERNRRLVDEFLTSVEGKN